jgi:excisionase family DNA binding protein
MRPPPNLPEPWVSIDDVAAHLGVTKLSIYRWIESRGLPATKLGKLWKLKLSEVEDWMRTQSSPAERSAAQRRRVMVIDDDDHLRTTIADSLHDQGYLVSLAQDGREALHLAEAEPPDLILLDLQLPHLDGFGFREAQRHNYLLAQVPVVVITADATASLEGVALVLRKPFRLPVLLSAIESLLATEPT